MSPLRRASTPMPSSTAIGHTTGRERHGDGQEQRVRPGGAPAAACLGAAQSGRGHPGPGDQRQQDREDGGAEPAGGERAGGGGQEGVGDGHPGAQLAGGEERARGEVGGEAGQRDRADEQQGQREAGGAEAQCGQDGDDREVGRRGLGAAHADGVPGVGVAGPQGAGTSWRGQQGAAHERAAAVQAAAGDERDDQEQREEDRRGSAGDLLEAGELFDLQEVGVVAAGPRFDGAVPGAAGVLGARAEARRDRFDGGADGGAGRREQGAQLARLDGAPAALLASARGSGPAAAGCPTSP